MEYNLCTITSVYHLGLWRLTETILATAYEMQIKISEQLNLLHEIYMNFRLNFYRIFTNTIHELSIHIMADNFCESPYYATSPILVNTNFFNMIDS